MKTIHQYTPEEWDRLTREERAAVWKHLHDDLARARDRVPAGTPQASSLEGAITAAYEQWQRELP
jgi:hypothetical protein